MFDKVFKGIPILGRKRVYLKKMGHPFGHTPHPNLLKVLKKYAVPPGGVLNPYGHYGNTRRGRYRATWFKLKLKPALREEAMKRTVRRERIRLQVKKALALEAHELQLRARENANLAMDTLIEIASSKHAPEATRIAASSVILDRAYGKATHTSITASVTNGKASEVDSTELDKRAAQALKRIEELTDRTPKKGTGKERLIDIRKYN